jgi:hypothetical protein
MYPVKPLSSQGCSQFKTHRSFLKNLNPNMKHVLLTTLFVVALAAGQSVSAQSGLPELKLSESQIKEAAQGHVTFSESEAKLYFLSLQEWANANPDHVSMLTDAQRNMLNAQDYMPLVNQLAVRQVTGNPNGVVDQPKEMNAEDKWKAEVARKELEEQNRRAQDGANKQ